MLFKKIFHLLYVYYIKFIRNDAFINLSSKRRYLKNLSNKLEHIDKKFEIENHSCHSNAKEDKSKNLCFECDCYLTQLLSNVVSSCSILDISKFNFEFIIKYYSINKKIKDPPPKRIS